MEVILIYIFLTILGAIIGLITGGLGLGGGFLMVPILTYIFQSLGISEDNSIAFAVGTSLSVIFVTSLKSAYEHHKLKNIIFNYSLLLGISGLFGTIVGVHIVTNYLDGGLHKMLFGIILIILSLNMALNTVTPENELDITQELKCDTTKYPLILAFGIIMGVLSSVFGIGGGTIAVPVLTLCLKLPIKKSVGTSLGMMSIVSLGGFLGYLSSPVEILDSYKYLNFVGYVSISSLISISISSIIFSKYGAELSNRLDAKSLKRFFAGILFIVGLKMVI
ncbi:protein of unknown function DUF81 [Methanococcus vannielii SB]|uniref:Probable membrane transporter protein n=1 Tax=Methanococcus vannielii (strain ATCC 35089 / DSM 1224 / JCM 13029 / OCM 148 / SB) TaxID=406327 RepID=A6UNT4_METVS|nr:sulfite exporter TauE/SafE family protein [Methanococcus vannielii]ABR54156.1 protein of unknown function DUF81 [Methanococcus vannielii SB]